LSSVEEERRTCSASCWRETAMFVQVFQGKVSDAGKVRAVLERWPSELGPGATGWLGSTSGVTEDGTLVALARFSSPEEAKANSDRPEQGAWWEELAALFTDEPVFHDSTYVEVDQHGDPDTAGFVQVMQGRTKDPDRARELMAADPTDWATYRPTSSARSPSATGPTTGRWRSTSPPRRRRARASARSPHRRWRR
jgi:hypothetical protein